MPAIVLAPIGTFGSFFLVQLSKSFGGSKKCSIEIEVSIILLNLHQFSARPSLTSEELEGGGPVSYKTSKMIKICNFSENFLKMFKIDLKMF